MTPVPDLSKALDLSILKDKSVLVTGGASGLGALIASSFAEHGYVLVHDNVIQSQHSVELVSQSRTSTKVQAKTLSQH